MSSQGKKGKKNKGKTLNLNDFLASGSNAGDDSTTVMVVNNQKSSWADEMEEEDSYVSYKAPQQIVLPTAPRAARGLQISEDRIPKEPPFTAYIANLPYEVEEKDIMKFFAKLNPKNIRLPREGDSETGRLKGFGYADFHDRQSLIDALEMNDHLLMNRKIRIDLAGSKQQSDRPDGRRGRYQDNADDRTMGNWRSGPPPEPSNYERRDDRRSGGYGGYDRDRGERDTFDRSQMRSADDMDRRRDDRYDNRRNDRYERRNNGSYNNRNSDPPKERPRLNLAKRSVPLDNNNQAENASSIFGGAKPVDTAKKELEIEEKLRASNIKEEEEEEAKPKAVSNAAIFGQAKPVDTTAKEREIEEKLKKKDEEEHAQSEERPSSRQSGTQDKSPERAKEDHQIERRSNNYRRDDYNRHNDRRDDHRRDDYRRDDRRDDHRRDDRRDDHRRDDRRDDYRRDDRRDDYRRDDRRDYGRDDRRRDYPRRDYDDHNRRDDNRVRRNDYNRHDRRDNRDRRDYDRRDRDYDRRDYNRRDDNRRNDNRRGGDYNQDRRDNRREDAENQPQLKKADEVKAPNIVSSNKYSFLAEDDTGTSGQDSE